jgi:hypothetical protein
MHFTSGWPKLKQHSGGYNEENSDVVWKCGQMVVGLDQKKQYLFDEWWQQRTTTAKVTKASMQTRVFPPPTNPRPPNRNAQVIKKWVEARLHNEGQGPALSLSLDLMQH